MALKLFVPVVACVFVVVALPGVTATAQFLQQQPLRRDLTALMDVAAPNSTEGLDMTASAMEAAITDLMMGKTAFGATPMGGSVKKITDLLSKTMMPKVIAAHKSDQSELNRLVAEIKKCGSTKASALKGAAPKLATYKKESKFHKSCRADEAVKYTSKKTCLSQQKSLYGIKVEKCKTFASISKKYGSTTNNHAITKKASSETVEGYVTRLSLTICGKHVHGTKGSTSRPGGWGGGLSGGFLDKYLRAKGACEAATKAYKAKVKECKRKVHSYNRRKAKCNQYQSLMDSASCKGAVLVKDACESYAGCYFSKKRAYTIAERKVKSDEVDRKAEWRGLKRMECLMGAFADGKVTNAEVDACKKKSHSTSHLNIEYPKVPPLVKCTVPSLYPATGAYKRAEIDPLPMLAKGKAMSECSGVAEVSLTPFSGSPKGCKCRRVTLNGPYSAGPLVKCSNCRDVRTSYQKNSCPSGTKIFSPASRADWQTFFNSAKALYAPHWIVDVTRPQNGCGGCTSNPMNSGNKFQRSWHTSDGSPWWLRSTRYSEPNGDYNANCFLNLWHNPRRATAVTFNDGRCNYHAKSYYCQPEKKDLKPKPGSPHSCKCSLVTLTGKYSAGSLVRCDQCLTVYKAQQKNSCPAGMKIFSPRTRQDWKTFIASATPLRAPHWIIDVTRPQNGCGGCTRYPMKSTTPQQATWRTSDGSPWWLRSTRYNEPNGDYTANCFMDLWRKPSSERNVQMNDWRCNYRSRSYYCQPTKAALKPKKAPAVKKSAVLGFKIGLQWVLSAKGVSCLDTCKKMGGSCAEHKYPKTLKAFKEIHSKKIKTGPANWQCYLDRYPDLQKAFGKKNVAKAQKHWKDHGEKEGRINTCPPCRRIYTGGWKFNPTMEPDKDCFWRGHGTNRCRGDTRGRYAKTQQLYCPCQIATSWIHANDGETCTSTCKRRGKKCVEDKWPKKASDMAAILKTTGVTCRSMHVGSWKGNPTLGSGARCWWKGHGGGRCDVKPGRSWKYRRFCPCE